MYNGKQGNGNMVSLLLQFSQVRLWNIGYLSFNNMQYFTLHYYIVTTIYSIKQNAYIKYLPWCFAYDRQNYDRYLSTYYAEMIPGHCATSNKLSIMYIYYTICINIISCNIVLFQSVRRYVVTTCLPTV